MTQQIGQGGFGFLDEIQPAKINLRARFLVPPFTLLDTRAGYWRERKAEWLGLGIQSEIGRGDGANSNASKLGMGMCDRLAPRDKTSGTMAFKPPQGDYDYPVEMLKKAQGTSIFDPVLCELVYRWFCPVNGNVLDPFAGGSVRGIVAGMMKLSYTGFDLSARQIEANEAQKTAILGDAPPVWWINEDARNIQQSVKGLTFDFVFSCPPYYNLEVYTDDPADLSQAKTYEDFLAAYMAIIMGCVDRLKDNRFACFVVGNIRDKRGFYHDLVGDTVQAFAAAGVGLYNEAVLMNAVGSLPIRVTKQFNSGRKMGKCHQNVLVFYKGDPSRIKHEFGGDVIMEWAND